MFWIGFAVGVVVGANIGFVMVALLTANSR